jgi:hypothetical protein
MGSRTALDTIGPTMMAVREEIIRLDTPNPTELRGMAWAPGPQGRRRDTTVDRTRDPRADDLARFPLSRSTAGADSWKLANTD